MTPHRDLHHPAGGGEPSARLAAPIHREADQPVHRLGAVGFGRSRLLEAWFHDQLAEKASSCAVYVVRPGRRGNLVLRLGTVEILRGPDGRLLILDRFGVLDDAPVRRRARRRRSGRDTL